MTQPSGGFAVSADTVPVVAPINVGVSPSPFNDPGSWDSITVGGLGGQGVTLTNVKIQLRQARRHFSWQYKKGPGTRGDVNTYRGTHTNSFQLLIWVWTDTQWAALQSFVACFNYNDNNLSTSTGEPNVNPVDISHPSLDYLNIHQVICEWIEAPEVDQDRSGWAKVTFGLHEFLPVVPSQNVTSTPKGAQSPIVVINRLGGSVGRTLQSEQNAISALAPSLPTTLP